MSSITHREDGADRTKKGPYKSFFCVEPASAGCSIEMRPGCCRYGHNHSRDSIAHREHELLHEPVHTGVVDHHQVACSEEEVQALQQHPGEGGQVEIV